MACISCPKNGSSQSRLEELGTVLAFLCSATRYQTIHYNIAALANAKASVCCLRIHRWIPGWIEKQYAASTCQGESMGSHTSGEQTGLEGQIPIESVHVRLAFSSWNCAINSAMFAVCCPQHCRGKIKQAQTFAEDEETRCLLPAICMILCFCLSAPLCMFGPLLVASLLVFLPVHAR